MHELPTGQIRFIQVQTIKTKPNEETKRFKTLFSFKMYAKHRWQLPIDANELIFVMEFH